MSIIAQIPVGDGNATFVYAIGELAKDPPLVDSSLAFAKPAAIFANAVEQLDAEHYGVDYLKMVDCATKPTTFFLNNESTMQIRVVVACPSPEYARGLIEATAANWQLSPYTTGRLFVHADANGFSDPKQFLSEDWNGRL
jgi:hypothetical protein